jgi:hypothetical protein
MTTHEADRPASGESVDEQEYDRAGEPDAYAVEADVERPVEGEPDATLSREDDALDVDDLDVDSDTDDPDDAEPELAEPELVGTDEADERARPPWADAGYDETPEPDPLQKLAPVGPEAAMDPGTGSYQDRWGAIQAGFIDDPRRTVETASALVTEIWDETVRAITEEREGIEGRWQNAESSTDDLRMAMQDYRSLYARLCDFTSN